MMSRSQWKRTTRSEAAQNLRRCGARQHPRGGAWGNLGVDLQSASIGFDEELERNQRRE